MKTLRDSNNKFSLPLYTIARIGALFVIVLILSSQELIAFIGDLDWGAYHDKQKCPIMAESTQTDLAIYKLFNIERD